MSPGRRFLLGSAGAAGGVALLAALFARLVPELTWRGGRAGAGVGWEGPWEVWLLTLFTAGVLALLAAASAWIGQALGGRGAREGLAELRARGVRLEEAAREGGREGSGGKGRRGDEGRGRPGAPLPGAFGRSTGMEGLAEGPPVPLEPGGGRSPAGGGASLPAGWFAAVGGWLLLLYAGGWFLGG